MPDSETRTLTDLPDDPPKLLTWKLELPLIQRVLRLGTWVILAMVTQFFVNYFDTLMLGRLEAPLATASQAALGLGMPVFWGIGGFFAAIGAGTQAIVGRRFAEGDLPAAGLVLRSSLHLALVCGVLGMLVGWYVTPAAIRGLATASAHQEELAIQYTQLRMLGIGGMVLTFSYKAFFDAIGRTQIHLWAAVVMNLGNLVLNYFLIYGFDPAGIPRLEIRGAALASVVSTYLGLAIMVGTSFARTYRTRFHIYSRPSLDWTLVARIGRLMLPSGIATAILMLGFALFMGFVGTLDNLAGHGTNTYTAATKAIMDTASLCFMPLIAFGTATATCVSQSLGRDKTNLAARYGWESTRLAVYAMLLVGACTWTFPEWVIGLLSPNDPAVIAAAVPSLRLVSFAFAPMAVGLVLAQALYGAGANVFVASAEFVLHFGVLVPLSWLLGPKLGLGMVGIWSAAAMYATLFGVVMAIKFAGPGWRRIKL